MSISREEQRSITSWSLMILAAVALTAALGFMRPVLIPFVLAIFISILVAPLMEFLEGRLRLPRSLSVPATILVALALVALLGLILTASIFSFLENADDHWQGFTNEVGELMAVAEAAEFESPESAEGESGPDGVEGTDATEGTEESAPKHVFFGIDFSQEWILVVLKEFSAVAVIGTVAEVMINLLSNGFLVLIFVIFLIAGRQTTDQRAGMYVDIENSVRQYLSLKMTLSAVTGLLVGLILWLVGLDLALFFGVLAFLLNFIPSIGSVIATLLPIPVAIAQFDSAWTAILVVALPGVVQLTIGNYIEPKLMGKGLELHPVTVLLTLAFWGLLWGVVGMVLAVPITAVLRIVLLRFETTRPIAELFAG